MRRRFTRTMPWSIALLFTQLLEPTRCGLQTVMGRAAEIRPAIAIIGGKTDQGFPYLFGGVSTNERELMEERAKHYNLRLMFAEKNGPYLSDVTLALASVKEGELVTIATNGPWFFIQLPPGTYNVKATFQGETKQINNLQLTKGKTVQQTIIWDLGREAEP